MARPAQVDERLGRLTSADRLGESLQMDGRRDDRAPFDRPAQEAVAELVERDGARILGLGLKLCGNRADAEDLVQETFLQAFRKWDQFEGRSSPSSWLYTIAVRICRRRHRLRAGEPARIESLDELLPSGDLKVAQIPSLEESAFDGRLRQELAVVVDRALEALPLDFRLPLVLKEIADLSLSEIAEVLAIKEATVKTRLYRARLALRKELVASLPREPAPPPDHPRGVCLDLLRGKMAAMDRGVPFPVAGDELCTRCRSMFDSLDLTIAACRWIHEGTLSDALRDGLISELRE
jgi:RNA polymerase sigma-70 factor (ECF subfamily)